MWEWHEAMFYAPLSVVFDPGGRWVVTWVVACWPVYKDASCFTVKRWQRHLQHDSCMPLQRLAPEVCAVIGR